MNEKGELSNQVSEITIAGNLRDMLKKIIIFVETNFFMYKISCYLNIWFYCYN